MPLESHGDSGLIGDSLNETVGLIINSLEAEGNGGKVMCSQRTLTSCALVLAVMASEGIAVAQNEDIEGWERSAWRMNINLDAPNLIPPAVQWTVVDKDPIPGFGTKVKRMSGYRKEQLQRADDEAAKERIRSSDITVSWDLGFKEVTGDKVYLLVTAPDVFQAFG